ncbi:MAG: hypothetical protein D6715_10035 [Calditrichaeota bacterium]|nr:MAG: hypothetical protein D6715_10035 [Calditrichota bacterium]
MKPRHPMMWIWPLLLALVVGLWLPLPASDNIAVVIRARGRVKLSHKNLKRTIAVKKSQPLVSGDRLQTGPASFCAFRFLDDRSLVRLRENSSCVIEGKKSKTKVDKNIFVQVGAFFASLFKQRGEFKVTTPTSVASVKGTKFWVIQSPDGPTMYVCTEGVVEVVNDAGKVLVRAGQTATVKSRTSQPVVRLTREGDIPGSEAGGQMGQSLEIEFQNPQGQSKTMKIELQKGQ